MHFTLRQLQVFTAIAQQESVSRAAETLSMSQSAASTALGELERQFSCQLFDRHGKRLVLNALGLQLLPRSRALLDQAEEIEILLRDRQGFGSLKLGATLTIGNYLAPLLLGHFMQRHPECRTSLQVCNTAQIIRRIAHHEVDLGLIEGEFSHPDIERQLWIHDQLTVFCAPNHPLAAQGYISQAALQSENWILRESGSGTRQAFDQAMQARPVNIRLELAHTEAIKRAVESGLGIGCISRLALRDAFRRGTLVPLESDLNLQRAFYFIWQRRKFRSAAMQAFMDLCIESTRDAVRSDQIELPAFRAGD